MRDVLIIGGGPAGLSAAIYAKRAALDVAVIEKEGFAGGQIINTEQVDNYLGLNGLSGYELAMKYKEHAEALLVDFIFDKVEKIENSSEIKKVKLANGKVLEAKNIIIASGASHKKLSLAKEKKLTGSGVSYCATCDGAFFRNKSVAVVGGGDVALQDAYFLSRFCEKIYLAHRREELRAAKTTVEKVLKEKNIVFLPNRTVEDLLGEFKLEGIVLKKSSGELEELKVDGLFVAIGMEPATNLFQELVELDEKGYIIAGEDCRTSANGIYAVGDVRTKEVRQLVTAVADGACVIDSLTKDMNK